MKTKILVVDDSAQQRAHIVEVLLQRGYAVVEASGGFEALRVIQRERPDVVVLDVVLDDIDGHSVCRMLRMTDLGRDLGVVMLTVNGRVKDRVEGLSVGADDYLPKPFDADELDARVCAVHRARAGRRELRRRNEELEGKLAQTERSATRDALTSLVTRSHFIEVLRDEWVRATRHGHAISCAILDLDRFKQMNDRLGHAAADDLLRRVGQLLRLSVRNVDLCARFGGDEFALLLPHTPLQRSYVTLEGIRTRLHIERKTWARAGTLTFSAGLASSEDADIRSPDDLIRAADRALDEAKSAGRDRIVMARSFELDEEAVPSTYPDQLAH